MTILEIILTAVASLLTVVTGGGGVLFRRQQKRTKTAEAFRQEVDAMKVAIETMELSYKAQIEGLKDFYKNQFDMAYTRIDKLQSDLQKQDVMNSHLRSANDVLEVKHAKNKSAINRAHECAFCDTPANCPVLKQRSINEEEYLRSIEKKEEK